jgi:hypothetical protein
MKPEFVHGNVRANCLGCGGAVTTFEHNLSGNELGCVVRDLSSPKNIEGRPYFRIIYHLLKCAGCNRAGLAEVFVGQDGNYRGGVMGEFLPHTIDMLTVPRSVPPGVQSEFREAELCASVAAWRAGSSLLRSTLEKTLRANGYDNGSLAERIDQAAADGVITAARSKRAHEEIRVLGNDVLHDEWREVTRDEFDLAHRYAQRILEDFYDDRQSVEALLIAKNRIKGE